MDCESDKDQAYGLNAAYIIGNPTDKRVGFLKITLINELGGVIS